MEVKEEHGHDGRVKQVADNDDGGGQFILGVP